MRLYSFRITEGGTLKRDFVPCIRTADVVAGLYDMVEGKFYGNSGSGNFAMSASNLPFGRELASGTYEINESFAFVAPPMESALKIAEGATVTLNIPVDVAVTLRGGDAFEVWGAGAGIEVPADATLKVTGAGQLVAYGGKGANGCDGMAGGNGSADGSGSFTSGAGGAGGWGGGGAGAGIGGHGASGGGGNGGASVTSCNWEHTDLDGNAGSNGGAGKNGGTCGAVSIEGTAKVFAYGGAAGDAADAGGAAGTRSWGEGSTYWFCAFGGGGGGGGAKGGAAAVRAIPGLMYALVRGESVEAVCGGETPPPQGMDAPQRVICESVVATGARVALTDANPPEGGAFYAISVSCPAAVGPSDSTIRIVGGRVYSGQYDITDAVTVRGDGTVELKAGGVVNSKRVKYVLRQGGK